MTEEIIKLIQSDDYKERLKWEILELRERLDKLTNLIEKYYNGTLESTPISPITPIYKLEAQRLFMTNYLQILYCRAKLEGVIDVI